VLVETTQFSGPRAADREQIESIEPAVAIEPCADKDVARTVFRFTESTSFVLKIIITILYRRLVNRRNLETSGPTNLLTFGRLNKTKNIQAKKTLLVQNYSYRIST